MIPVPRPGEEAILSVAARRALARRRSTAAEFLSGDARIPSAWSAFLRSTAKDDVVTCLDRVFRFKCAYCEAVAAQDIEHFYPKTTFPDRMFAWTNFLRGCKNCNNAKRDFFPMDGEQPVLLDPCAEEPLDFFVWDFLTGGTGIRPEPPFERRGQITRDRLNLDQEPLREERRKKLGLVLYLLSQVANEEPVQSDTREQLREELDRSRPWLGIIRQLFRHPGRYAPLVEIALAKLPDLREWIVQLG